MDNERVEVLSDDEDEHMLWEASQTGSLDPVQEWLDDCSNALMGAIELAEEAADEFHLPEVDVLCRKAAGALHDARELVNSWHKK